MLDEDALKTRRMTARGDAAASGSTWAVDRAGAIARLLDRGPRADQAFLREQLP